MIPSKIPPPPESALWTPNALGPSAASIVNIATPTVTDDAAIPSGTGVVRLYRRLTPANMTAVAGTTFNMGIPATGFGAIPFMVTCQYSITSAAAYNTTQSLGVRYSGGTADIMTVSAWGTLVERRVFIAGPVSAPGVNAGSFAVASGGRIILRNTFTNPFLGVPGTDSVNYCDVSVLCWLVALA